MFLLGQESNLLEYSVAAGVTLILMKFIVEAVLKLLKASKPGTTDPATESLETLRVLAALLDKEQAAQLAFRKTTGAQIKELYDWHNKTDEDGVPVWYVKKGLETAIRELAQNIGTQTIMFERINLKLDQALHLK